MVHASGIPGLRRFCHSILGENRLLKAKTFLNSDLSSLLNSIELWTKSTLTRDDYISPVTYLKDVETKVWPLIFFLLLICFVLLFQRLKNFQAIDNVASTEEEVFNSFKMSILDFSCELYKRSSISHH